jgi:hypothetical protein
MPEGAYDVLIGQAMPIGVRIDGCRTVVTCGGSFQPRFAKLAFATELGVEHDPSTCEVTEAKAGAVVEKWGKPWTIVVLPPESTP